MLPSPSFMAKLLLIVLFVQLGYVATRVGPDIRQCRIIRPDFSFCRISSQIIRPDLSFCRIIRPDPADTGHPASGKKYQIRRNPNNDLCHMYVMIKWLFVTYIILMIFGYWQEKYLQQLILTINQGNKYLFAYKKSYLWHFCLSKKLLPLAYLSSL